MNEWAITGNPEPSAHGRGGENSDVAYDVRCKRKAALYVIIRLGLYLSGSIHINLPKQRNAVPACKKLNAQCQFTMDCSNVVNV